MKTKIYYLGLLLLLVIASCGGSDEKESETTQSTISVKTQKVSTNNTAKRYQFSAKIEAESQVQLSTKIMGEITYLPFKEGDRVTMGQTLVQVKSTDIQASSARIDANILEVEANLVNIEKNYNRIKTLYDNGSATQKELDDIETQYNAMKARIQAAEESKREVNAVLGYASVTAPFSGFVSKKFMEKGSLASPGMPILALESNGAFKAVANVPESEIGFFQLGDEVEVRIDAIDAKLKARVTQISPSSAFSQYEVAVLLQLDDETASKIKAGMFANVVLEEGEQSNLMIPKESIVQRGQLTGLYTVNQQEEAMLRWIRLGNTIGNQVEVLSGLQNGEEIILSSDEKLRDGIKIIRK